MAIEILKIEKNETELQTQNHQPLPEKTGLAVTNEGEPSWEVIGQDFNNKKPMI